MPTPDPNKSKSSSGFDVDEYIHKKQNLGSNKAAENVLRQNFKTHVQTTHPDSNFGKFIGKGLDFLYDHMKEIADTGVKNVDQYFKNLHPKNTTPVFQSLKSGNPVLVVHNDDDLSKYKNSMAMLDKLHGSVQKINGRMVEVVPAPKELSLGDKIDLIEKKDFTDAINPPIDPNRKIDLFKVFVNSDIHSYAPTP